MMLPDFLIDQKRKKEREFEQIPLYIEDYALYEEIEDKKKNKKDDEPKRGAIIIDIM